MNIVEMKQKEVVKESYIKITYASEDEYSETIQADSFGISTEFDNFMVAFSDKSEIPIGLYNTDFILKIEIINKEANENNS